MAESNPVGVGVKYTTEDLLFLRDSPLCVKPANLPPAEEWMGPPPDTTRNQNKPTTERTRPGDAPLAEQRRPGLDRAISRSSANPEDIILGPPRTSFASATTRGFKMVEMTDTTQTYSSFGLPRSEVDKSNDRFKDNRTNSAFRRRGDADQDSEGWSTVKPRKSFGTEGAERFHGRMGGSDRTTGRDDKRFRERDERESGDRRNRNTDQGAREKETEETDGSRWNGLGRSRTDTRKENSDGAPPPARERFDRAKSWRDRIPEDTSAERQSDRANDRGHDRRWDRDRDQRVEREPEWLDEPAEVKPQGRAPQVQDLQKWMEEMKARDGGASKTGEGAGGVTRDKPTAESQDEGKQKAAPTPVTKSGPDNFFASYGLGALSKPANASAEAQESSRPKTGKSSRFTSFFSAGQEDARGKSESAGPAATSMPADHNLPPAPYEDPSEKQAFAELLQKLQRQSFGTPSSKPAEQSQATLSLAGPSEQSSTPAITPGLAPPRPAPGLTPVPPPAMQQAKSSLTSPDPFQQHGGGSREDPRMRGPAPTRSLQDVLSPRPMAPPSQPPAARPEDVLLQQFFAGQRPQGVPQGGMEAQLKTFASAINQVPAGNQNTQYLMSLMQRHREAPEPLRTEQLMMRNPQPTKQVNVPNLQDRELDYERDRSMSQPQQRQNRPQGPQGFFDAQFNPADNDNRPQQPTQILQRPPPPPGLDHHIPQMQMGGAPQMPPQRPMIPPPPGINLMSGARIPDPRMFTANFGPPGAFPPPPESMVGPPPGGPGPRNMQVPPGFYGGPPPGLQGFMGPPPGGMPGFQGPPEGAMQFGGPPPPGYMAPPGAGGAAFRRQ